MIGLGIRIIDDCIVVDRLEAPADEPIDVSFLLPEIRELRRVLGEAAPEAVFVAEALLGLPQECLEYLDVEYGVVGAGEEAMAMLCSDTSGDRPRDLSGGDRSRGSAPTTSASAARRSASRSTRRRTRSRCERGSAARCSASTARRRTSAGGTQRRAGAVLDEIERTVARARERGVGRVDLLRRRRVQPARRAAPIAVPQGILERAREAHDVARVLQPDAVPPSSRTSSARPNGHVSITVDSAADSLLATAQKLFAGAISTT